MKKTRQFLALILALAMLCTCLIGCGAENGGNKNDGGNSQSQSGESVDNQNKNENETNNTSDTPSNGTENENNSNNTDIDENNGNNQNNNDDNNQGGNGTDDKDNNQQPPEVVIYDVTFKDYDGKVLKTEKVESNKAATAPNEPTRSGYKFAGWDKKFDKITSNLTITATYKEIINPLKADYKYNASKDELAVTIGIYDKVDMCSIDVKITYDTDLVEYVNYTNALKNLMINDYQSGSILLNYSGIEGVYTDITFITLNFKTKVDSGNVKLELVVQKIYDGDYNSTDYEIINNGITIG